MIAFLIAIAVLGNVLSSYIKSQRFIPDWVNAPLSERLMRLLWPTAIIVYLKYPIVDKGHQATSASAIRALNEKHRSEQ